MMYRMQYVSVPVKEVKTLCKTPDYEKTSERGMIKGDRVGEKLPQGHLFKLQIPGSAIRK